MCGCGVDVDMLEYKCEMLVLNERDQELNR